MSITLCFDTETTGLPAYGASWETDYARYPWIASVAWQVHDDKANLLYEAYHYIKPDGWVMSKEAGAINGLTTEFLQEKGVHPIWVYRHLVTDMARADRIIGHNVSFDTSMIKSNMLKYGIPKEKFVNAMGKEKRYCTKEQGLKMGFGNNGKWPRLEFLYNKLFKEEISGAHDALNDVKAAYRCYLELERIKQL